VCHVLHYSCNVNAAVADSLRCRMICGTVPSSVHACMPPAMAATWSPLLITHVRRCHVRRMVVVYTSVCWY